MSIVGVFSLPVLKYSLYGVSVRVGVAQILKFLVEVFMSLHLLRLLMDQIDTLHVGRYWSEVLCCTIRTHLGDLESRSWTWKFCILFDFLI